ncbi:MAG: hypothetical protein ACYCQJ_10465 [Nitrososphaerales archaeon]
MTEARDIAENRRYAYLKRVMDRSDTLDHFIKNMGRDPTATLVRLFIDYKSLVRGEFLEDRWVGERYMTREDFVRMKDLGLRISSFARSGKSVRVLRNEAGRFVSLKVLG